MEKRISYFGALLCFLLVMGLPSPSLQYREEMGFGFMTKYDPHFKDRQDAEASLTESIRSVINLYQKEARGGIPFLPDPFPVPQFQEKVTAIKFTLDNSQIFGLGQFKMERLSTDLAHLQVRMDFSLEELLISGRYTLKPWITPVEGNYDLTVSDVLIKIKADLVPDQEGFLSVSQISYKLSYERIEGDFQSLGFAKTVLQGVLNKLGSLILEKVEPLLLEDFGIKVREIVASECRDLLKQFPKSVNPVDLALARARKLILENALDPGLLADHATQSSKWSKFELYNGKLVGLSGIRRDGPILLGFERDTIYMSVFLRAEKLKGTYDWSWIALKGVFGRRSQLDFILDSLTIQIRIQQSKKLESKAHINSANMTIGQTSLVRRGLGAVDYLLETVFNVAPNMFRQRVKDAFEYRLLQTFEDELKKINLEDLIEEKE